MEPVFSRFDSYNFEADQQFVEGLKTLKMSENRRDGTEMLNLKLFFYNRFIEPIDRMSYKEWKSSHHAAAQGVIMEQWDQKTLSHSDSDTSNSKTTDACTHKETKQLSFMEVMQLVQEGKEVPGVSKVDIQPSNQSPTPSQMQRPQKPWETSAS